VAASSSNGSPKTYWDKIQETAAFIRARGAADPEFVIVLGSGLGVIAEDLDDQIVVPYSEIPYFHVSGVQGHAGRLVLGKMKGVPVMVLQVRRVTLVTPGFCTRVCSGMEDPRRNLSLLTIRGF
jgi:hypothetical protein